MLVYNVNKTECETFLKNHPEVLKSMKKYGKTGGKLLTRYCKWLKWKEKNESKIADYSETVNSPSFGTKTFYHVEWYGVPGHWAEVFQYVNG